MRKNTGTIIETPDGRLTRKRFSGKVKRHVEQSHKNYGCAQCCIAMLADVEDSESLGTADLTPTAMRAQLKGLGVAVTRGGTYQGSAPPRCLLFLKLKHGTRRHWVVRDGRWLYNPALPARSHWRGRVARFEIERFIALE